MAARSPKSPKKPAAATAKGQRRSLLRFTAKWSAIAAIWVFVAGAAMVAFFAYDLPDIDAALTAKRRPTVTLLAADGGHLATLGDLYGVPARLADLPPALPGAVLATEDRRFYDHMGVDFIGLARAMVANIKAGRIVQGGSTLTQQAAKNLFLTPDRTIKRKVQELLLALWLEDQFTKDQILTIYLNRVYFGAGTYGVTAAARKYFGVPPKRLTIYQSAMLAGLLKAPSRLRPDRNPKGAAKRTAQVLANMVAAGYLSAAEAGRASLARGRAPAVLAAASASRRGRQGRRYFGDWIIEQLPSFVGPAAGDITVVTTLDPKLQSLAEKAVSRGLATTGGQARQAALIALDAGGAVRAMVGGRDYGKSQFNRATQALRQPGSAFKPVVYLAGLQAGLTPETRLVDEPVSVAGWRPRNYSGTYQGEMSLRQALAQSVNTIAVKVANRVGRRRVAAAARRLGITADLAPDLSIALGASEVSLIELTAAYATFAAGGAGVWAHGISEIRDRRGRVIYRRTGDGPGQVIDARHAAQMNDMLSAVLATGTGRRARLTRPAAGKTGTSQKSRDAWFVGYTASLVAGVWLGNDDGGPMKGVTGGRQPAEIWRRFMTAAHQGLPPAPLAGVRALAPDALANDAPRQTGSGFWQRLVGSLGG